MSFIDHTDVWLKERGSDESHVFGEDLGIENWQISAEVVQNGTSPRAIYFE